MAKKKKVGKKRAKTAASKKAVKSRKKKKPAKAPKKAKAKAKPAKAKAKAKPAKAKAKAKPAKAKAKAKAKPVKAKAKPAKAKPAKAKATGAEKPAPAKESPALAEGAAAPSFELADQDGNLVSSDSLKGKPYVLYFYPKDDTTGCTKEACDFRDFDGRFGAASVRIVGVSPDSSASHAKFRSKYGLPFTLISDADKTLAQAYGVWVKKQNYGREYMGIERSTFLIDDQGTIKKAWRGVRVAGHVEDVLSVL